MNDEFQILIVDDEPNIRSGLARGLASETDRIETAADAQEALRIFDGGPFQLVIADVRLPGGLDGTGSRTVGTKSQGCAFGKCG